MSLLNNPVLARELDLVSRNWRVPALLTCFAALMGGAALVYLLDSGAGPAAGGLPLHTGVSLFSLLATVQLAVILLIAPGLTAGAISGERERQTLEPVLQTGLSPLALVLGKLGGALGYLTLMMSAAAPAFGLLCLLGGVGLRPLLLMYLVCLGTGLLLSTLGLCASALSRRTQAAAAAAYALTAVLVAATLLPAWLAGGLVGTLKINQHVVIGVAATNPVTALAATTGGPFFSPVLKKALGPASHNWQARGADRNAAEPTGALAGSSLPPAYAAMMSAPAGANTVLLMPVPIISYVFLGFAGGVSLLLTLAAVAATRPQTIFRTGTARRRARATRAAGGGADG